MKHLLITFFAILTIVSCGKYEDFDAGNSTIDSSINYNNIIIQFFDVKGEPIRDNFVLIDNVEAHTDVYGSVTVKDEEGDGLLIIQFDKGDGVTTQQFSIELVPQKILYQFIVKGYLTNDNPVNDR